MKALPCALLMLLLSSGCAVVPEHKPKRACFHADAAIEIDVGYCQAVRSGKTLYISGTAASGEMDLAVRAVYGGLRKTLEANGLTFANVVKENVYATNLDAFIKYKSLRKEFYGGASMPAATWVQVSRLYTPALVLEVELVAEYPR